MSDKPKVAFYWCASCGGCEETVVDLEEKILDVVKAIDIVFWPCAMDPKYSDLEAMDDGEIAISFINGAIRTSEQEHISKLLRKKSGVVIAFGSCAVMGGIPALANLKNKKDIFKRSYRDSPTNVNPEGVLPQTETDLDGCRLSLPEFYDTVYKLDDVIEVDYYMPGCPPTPANLETAVQAALKGELPEKGAVLLPDKSLCVSCDRNETKPDDITISRIRRLTEVQADPEECFLAQGIICMGPATRDGCEYPCVKGNMPCTGCFGPVSDADQGARMIASIGGIIDADDEGEVRDAVSAMPDPAGTFYRYSLSSSLLGKKREER
ncbi:MAG: oxidoreductase [Candidatus Krumholzibacteriota bacterium]|nr:oxidoreductase [Candidatus Krumholzibacteriota bacterium]